MAAEAQWLFSAFFQMPKPDDFFPPFFKFCVDFFPTFLTTLDVLRRLYSIFVFVLFAMQYKVRLGSTKCYHLF